MMNADERTRLLDALHRLTDAELERLMFELAGDARKALAPATESFTRRAVDLGLWLDQRPEEFLATMARLDAKTSARRTLSPATRTLIEYLAEDFVGRSHVFEAFDQFVASSSSGWFVVQGRPGEGKSALVARLVQQRGCPVHFNQALKGTGTTKAFVQSMHDQFAARPDWGVPAPTSEAWSNGQWFDEAVALAAERRGSGVLVLAVDALDEVEANSHASTTNPLCLPEVLPKGVFLFVTQRPGALPRAKVSREFDLRRHTDQNQRDARLYVELRSARRSIAEHLEALSMPSERFVELMVERADENFMYLRYVLDAVEQGTFDGRGLGELPFGLRGYYEDHWRRMGMTAADGARIKLRVLYVLTELGRPVSRALLAQVCGVHEVEVQQVLDAWRAFLMSERTPEGTLYRLYHASFRDFLRDSETLRASSVDLAEVNGHIARWADEGIPLDD